MFWIVKVLLKNVRNLTEILRRFFSFCWDRLKKILKTFFLLWKALAPCVLRPRPRAFLFLALRGFVLEKSVLGLGFFWGSLALAWSLVPRLHLWFCDIKNTRTSASSFLQAFSHSYFQGYWCFCKTYSYAMHTKWFCLMKRQILILNHLWFA